MSRAGTGSYDAVRAELAARIPLRRMPLPPRDRLAGTWRQARPARIDAALADALTRDPGGWFVVGARRDLDPRAGARKRAVRRDIDGREVVLWRDASGRLVAGSAACPHMGADLGGCEVIGDAVVCPWHGLALSHTTEGSGPTRGWTSYPTYEDGLLAWVRLPVDGEQPSEAPAVPPRPDPATAIAAVISRRGVCEPRDIIANRLDPWHGAWLHPYAFSHLTVDESASSEKRLVLDVAFRVGGPFAVPVTAEFVCPDARTIVMTILAGEGAGSVVETHATPLGADLAGRPTTVMTEVTVATSPRTGFAIARRLAPLVQVAMRRSAGQLWADDITYAERLWELRARA